jgi:hypothetical protein
VTVISIKLEQSALREDSEGTFPARVPVTALAQLSALHWLSLSQERTLGTIAKARKKDKSLIVVRESVCMGAIETACSCTSKT